MHPAYWDSKARRKQPHKRFIGLAILGHRPHTRLQHGASIRQLHNAFNFVAGAFGC
jgi:hypothetical protein